MGLFAFRTDKASLEVFHGLHVIDGLFGRNEKQGPVICDLQGLHASQVAVEDPSSYPRLSAV